MPARVDATQPGAVKRLRKMGAEVICLHKIGKGCPDLLVGYKGYNLLIEMKDGKRKPSEQKLTAAQREFFRTWPGQKAVARSPEGAVRIVRGLGKTQQPPLLS